MPPGDGMQGDNPQTISVHVLMFASARERSGVGEVPLVLPQGTTVAEALAELIRRHSRLKDLLPSLLVAVNEEWVPRTAPLANGDTLAIMPPVSGG